jgi:hypothetical protein
MSVSLGIHSWKSLTDYYNYAMRICGNPLLSPECSDDNDVWFAAFLYLYRHRQENPPIYFQSVHTSIWPSVVSKWRCKRTVEAPIICSDKTEIYVLYKQRNIPAFALYIYFLHLHGQKTVLVQLYRTNGGCTLRTKWGCMATDVKNYVTMV